MASYNKVVLVGNLTRDPQTRWVSNNSLCVCDIGLAVNERRRDPNSPEETLFIDVTFWGKTAETLGKCTKKGSQILVDGRLKLDTWETDGQKRTKIKVIGERMILLGARTSAPGGYPGGGFQGGEYPGYQQSQQYQNPGQYGTPDSGMDSYESGSIPGGDDVPF